MYKGGDIDSTCKRQFWVPMTFDQHLRKNDKRELIPMHGIPTLKTKSMFLGTARNNTGVKLTIAAYRNGMNSVCLTMSSTIHEPRFDFITSNAKEASLYHKEDFESLRKLGFKCSHRSDLLDGDAPSDNVHDTYYTLFKEMPVEMVTLDQTNKIWMFARGLGFTSSTIYPVISILCQHRHDFTEVDGLPYLLQFARKNIDAPDEEIQADNENGETETGANADNNQENDNHMDDNQILARGTIEGNHVHNARHDFLDITTNDVGDDNSRATLVMDRLNTYNNEYLHEFLRVAGMTSIPRNKTSMQSKLREWCSADPLHRPYELKTKQELASMYFDMFDHEATVSWSKKVLVQKLSDHNMHSRVQPDYKQKLLTEIIRYSFGMRPLKGDAKEICALGHFGEKAMSELLRKCKDSE